MYVLKLHEVAFAGKHKEFQVEGIAGLGSPGRSNLTPLRAFLRFAVFDDLKFFSDDHVVKFDAHSVLLLRVLQLGGLLVFLAA